jgi:hypothetical protein
LSRFKLQLLQLLFRTSCVSVPLGWLLVWYSRTLA